MPRYVDVLATEKSSFKTRAVSLVKWLWQEAHVLKVVGSNPGTVYWTDIFHIKIKNSLKTFCQEKAFLQEEQFEQNAFFFATVCLHLDPRVRLEREDGCNQCDQIWLNFANQAKF